MSNRSSRLSVRLHLLLCHLSAAVILYDEQRAERLASLGVPRQKLFVATNSVDTVRIRQLAQQNSGLPRTRILYVGRLIPEKKVALLLEGFALAVPHLPPEAMLTVIGDGPERASLEAMAHSMGLASKVEFVGETYDETRLALYFMSSWVSVSPGYVGLAAIHSMAYGVPLIVANSEPHSPEIAAVRDGVNALLFDSGDAASLARVLRSLADDPERLHHLSEAACQTIEKDYGLANMVRAFENALDYVLRAWQ